jgi:Zn-dependent alcohol dehydrogenase
MVSDQNVAAWLPGVGKPLEVRSAETPVPGEGELLVEVSERCQCQADPFRAAGD